MKYQTLRALLLIVAVTFIATIAHAQSVERYRAQIPFDFNVGKKHYAAGEYFVEVRGFESRSFIIRDANGRNSYMAVGSPSEWKSDPGTARLNFLKLGDRHILSTVKINDLASHFPQPAYLLLAGNTRPDTVSVALTMAR